MMMDDNELRNLYRKDGIYKVYYNSDNETHIFAVFQDLEKAILYRDLFESSNWNLDLKGITDITNPSSHTPTVNEVKKDKPKKRVKKTKAKPKKKKPVIKEAPVIEDTPVIKKTIIDDSELVSELNEIDNLLDEQSNNTKIEEELNNIDELLQETTKENQNTTTIEADLETSEIANDDDVDDGPDESFDTRYIHYKKGRGYCVEKVINGKQEFFGVFQTVDEAIEARDYFRNNNWNINKKNNKQNKKDTQYIYKNKKGFYEIKKKLNDKLVTFGRYKTIADAKTVRDYLIENNWNKEDLNKFQDLQINMRKRNPRRYIHKDNNGRHRINKRVNGELVNFGVYENFEDAKTARDYFEENDWNINDLEKFADKQYSPVNSNPDRYINKAGNTYQIYKNGVYFGRLYTLEEARQARDWLEEHDFSLEYKDKFRVAQQKKEASKNYFENMELF